MDPSIQRLSLNLTTLIGNKLVSTVSNSAVPIIGAASLVIGLLLTISVEALQIHRSEDRIKCISKQIEAGTDSKQAEKLNQLLIAEYANLDTHKII